MVQGPWLMAHEGPSMFQTLSPPRGPGPASHAERRDGPHGGLSDRTWAPVVQKPKQAQEGTSEAVEQHGRHDFVVARAGGRRPKA